MSAIDTLSALIYKPVTADSFPDLAAFFERHGNPNYCWCMRWRMKSAEFQKANSNERRGRLQALVAAGTPLGVLAYQEDKVVGWCSVAPRETYPLLEASTTLKRLDDRPVWSVVCFFMDPELRGRNMAVPLLRAAADYAFSQGATIVEGYPVEPDKSYRFMGSPSTFEQAGFREAGTAKNGRKIVRLLSVH